jgi:hypothetical protein
MMEVSYGLKIFVSKRQRNLTFMDNKMIVGTRCFLNAYKKSDFENQFDSAGLLVRMGSSPIAHNTMNDDFLVWR